MSHKNAGFSLRFLAWLTEFFIFLFLHTLFWQYISQSPNLTEVISRLLIYFIILVFSPLGLIYNLALTYYAGGTLGKLLTGLKITSTEGKKLSFKKIMFRQTIGYQFAALLFGTGFFAIIKDPEKRGWHDKTVNSKVIINQNQWPLSLVALIAFLLLSISTIGTSINNLKTSPTKFEIGPLARLYQVQEEIKQEQQKDSTQSAQPVFKN